MVQMIAYVSEMSSLEEHSNNFTRTMKAVYLFIGIFLCSFLLISCGHTNNLTQYDIVGKRAFYRAHSSTSGSSKAIVDSPDNDNIVADIVAIIGSGVVSDRARKKLPHSSLKCNRWRSFTTIYFPGCLPPQTFPRAIV